VAPPFFAFLFVDAEKKLPLLRMNTRAGKKFAYEQGHGMEWNRISLVLFFLLSEGFHSGGGFLSGDASVHWWTRTRMNRFFAWVVGMFLYKTRRWPRRGGFGSAEVGTEGRVLLIFADYKEKLYRCT
jgi:hypothetical protein